MSAKAKRNERRRSRREPSFQPNPFGTAPAPSSKELIPRTPAQERHLKALRSQTCVISIGPAGTGKTYMGAAYAVRELAAGNIERIILTRPAVEAGEELGFLKGDLEEKFLPYLAPYLGVFRERMGPAFYDHARASKAIEAVPLAYMQGMTFRNAVVLFDEAENASPQSMKLLLTRMGDGCRAFISGDLAQQYSKGDSGLADAIHRLKGVPGVAIIRYEVADVVRSEFQRRVLEAYDNDHRCGLGSLIIR